MKKLMNKVMNAAKHYTIWDYSILKTSLVSLGILLGAYFSAFFLSHILFIWILFIISYLMILYKTFIKK